MEINKILDKTSELTDAITKSDLFMEYKSCQDILTQDQQFTKKLDHFLKEKEQYEEVTKYGKHHPDLNRVRKSYQEAKIDLMSNQTFKRFKRIEKELEEIVFQIEKELKELVGIKDKHSKSSLKFLY